MAGQVPSYWGLLLWCLSPTMWSCGTVPSARAWVHGLKVSIISSPVLASSRHCPSYTLLAWLAVWAQVRPTHVPSSPAPYQCAYKLKWPCSMGTSFEAEISVELPSYQR